MDPGLGGLVNGERAALATHPASTTLSSEDAGRRVSFGQYARCQLASRV